MISMQEKQQQQKNEVDCASEEKKRIITQFHQMKNTSAAPTTNP